MFPSRTLLSVVIAALATSAVRAAAAPVVFPDNGHVYEVIVDDAISWSGARAAAQASGRDLATITSAAEQAFVESLLESSNAPTGSYWFGLRQTAEGGGANLDTFGPVSGGPSAFSHYAVGEPNDGGIVGEGESVGGIFWTRTGDSSPVFGRRGGWNDLPDSGYPNATNAAPGEPDLRRAGYIVEADAGGPTPVPLPAAALLFPGAALFALLASRRMGRLTTR